jgi:endoglucanase
MLTIAAAHVINDTSDPFYTSLQAGAYEKVKPKGKPCDSANQDGCIGGHLNTAATIGLAVSVVIVGVVVIGLSMYYLWRVRKNKY